MDYKPTIGLEIHAELSTKTKMFCACKNDTDEVRPNINICPVCMGHPGTLPVINREAVRRVLQVGIAVGGKLADESEFDRKNYFYPDIPKGYQISQYKYPLVSGGQLAGVALTRVHLEEDTAKSTHDSGDYSLVDFNRAGVPLMELVTEPVLHSGLEVLNFGKELQLLLQALGVSYANMEKGEMRLEVNISLAPRSIDGVGVSKLGTKVEIKNINSFKAAEKAIAYEIIRQSELLEKGELVKQETRGWDEIKQVTFSQRSKEDSHDYRYFPDPDLPKLKLSEIPDFSSANLILSMKETPEQKRIKLSQAFGIKSEDIEFYVSNSYFGNLFEKSASFLKDPKDFQLLSNYIVSDIAGLVRENQLLNPEHIAKLIKMFSTGLVSSRGVKDILNKMVDDGGDPEDIAKNEGLFQKSDREELTKVARIIIDKNGNIISEYKNGKISALQFLVGEGMKATKGSANPQVLKAVFEELLTK